MTRERFIKKWLGNNDFKYCEEHKELMRDDLDAVIKRSKTSKEVDYDYNRGYNDAIKGNEYKY